MYTHTHSHTHTNKLTPAGTQRGTSVIPKASSEAHLAANIAAATGADGFTLSPADFKTLSSLPVQARLLRGVDQFGPELPYKTYEDLWDEEDPVTGKL